MSLLVHGILLLWLVLVPCACFTRIPRHLVLGAACILGLLFLPMVHEGHGIKEDGPFSPIVLPGLTLTKYKVISLALLLAVLLREGLQLLRLRLSWVDLPMICWCLCPLPSVLESPPPDGGPAFQAGMSQLLVNCLLWGVPYFIGKLYFGSLSRLRDLAALFVLGALLYVPFFLFEVRMSPQLHFLTYGFSQHDFVQSIRFDGYRPMVYMQHGLALALFIATATLVASALWWSGAAAQLPEPIRVRSRWLGVFLLLILVGATVLTRSTGAWLLGALGFVVLFSAFRLHTVWLLICILLVSPLYLATRTSGAWTGASLVPLLQAAFTEERADSFEFRQKNEDLLMQRAFEGPPFGWAGWGRNLVYDLEGNPQTIPDGMWIIALGERGLPGLICFYLALLLPVVRFLWLQPVSTWSQPASAGAAACAIVVVLFMLDNLMNAMHNPVFVLMAGALAGIARPRAPEPPPPLSVTDRRVFRWSLFVSRRERTRLERPSQSPD